MQEKHNVFEIYGQQVFYKKLTEKLAKELWKALRDVEQFKQTCNQHANETAESQTKAVAENLPENWQNDSSYADILQGSPALVANGIEKAKITFHEDIDRFA